MWDCVEEFVPIFRIDYLVRFIQEKSGLHMKINYFLDAGYEIIIFDNKNETTYENLKYDLLKALWFVACDVAREKEKRGAE